MRRDLEEKIAFPWAQYDSFFYRKFYQICTVCNLVGEVYVEHNDYNTDGLELKPDDKNPPAEGDPLDEITVNYSFGNSLGLYDQMAAVGRNFFVHFFPLFNEQNMRCNQ